jgi:hypothetical protein
MPNSKSDAFENDILKYIFNNVVDLGATVTYALHTADPMLTPETGNQTTSETAYTNYARVSKSRSGTADFTVTGSSVSPAADVDFPACGATAGGPITHFSIGTGVGNKIMYSGQVLPNIAMATGVIPRLKTTSTITED